MSDFFTQEEKLTFSNLFNDLHDTYAREIYMFKQRNELVITNNPNHSYVWDDAPDNTQPEFTLVSGSFKGRILYANKQDKGFLSTKQIGGGEDQLKDELFDGDVRIKLDPTGAAFIGDSQKARFDDVMFEIISHPRPHGLFEPKWQTFYLKRAN